MYIGVGTVLLLGGMFCSDDINTDCIYYYIIESVDSISRDERDVPLTQYITNA